MEIAEAGPHSEEVSTVHIVAESLLPPERVLAAVYDSSERRARVWPAVSVKHMEVHELGETSADVTEGTRAGPTVNWERCRYDGSQPGSVRATDLRISAEGDFGGDPITSTGITYSIDLAGDAPEDDLRRLVADCEAGAAIPHTLRQGTGVQAGTVRVHGQA